MNIKYFNRRKVNKEVASKFHDDYGLDLFMEASAKTGFNAKNVTIYLNQVFIEAAKTLYKDYLKYKDSVYKYI